jgi:hypothetical protein
MELVSSFFYVKREVIKMFKINSDKSIWLTRGDVATINVTAKNSDKTQYTFKKGDILRFNVFQKNSCHKIVMSKDVTIDADKTEVQISLTSNDTRIGDIISKPVEYWYEIALNPDTAQQTIVGYAEEPAILKLLPEGDETV